MYGNEREAGEGITSFLASKLNTAGLKREDIHYTTKLAYNRYYDAARQSISQSVKKGGLGYVDLFLLHSPYGGTNARLESWRAVEDAVEAGEVRIGGVSNFGVKHVSKSFHFSLPSCFTALMDFAVRSKSFWRQCHAWCPQ